MFPVLKINVFSKSNSSLYHLLQDPKSDMFSPISDQCFFFFFAEPGYGIGAISCTNSSGGSFHSSLGILLKWQTGEREAPCLSYGCASSLCRLRVSAWLVMVKYVTQCDDVLIYDYFTCFYLPHILSTCSAAEILHQVSFQLGSTLQQRYGWGYVPLVLQTTMLHGNDHQLFTGNDYLTFLVLESTCPCPQWNSLWSPFNSYATLSPVPTEWSCKSTKCSTDAFSFILPLMLEGLQ